MKVAAKADPLLGRTVGSHYTLERLLGTGVKGRVYLASHRTLHRTVAVKLLPEAVASTPESRARFEREAKALQGLEHPNITAVHDFGFSTEFGAYVVVEYVEGTTLDEFLGRNAPLSIEVFVPIAAQVLKAMGAAHARGLLHRALKPSNILLIEHKGRANFVKICDLGLLQIFGDVADQANAEASAGFWAPEQVQQGPLDPRTDVYGIGVLFYTMLAGRKPFQGTDAQVLYKIINDQPTPLAPVLRPGHDVPDGVVELVRACLSKNPNERPIDANEIVEYLIDSVPAAMFRLPKAEPAKPRPAGVVAVATPIAARESLPVAPIVVARPPSAPVRAASEPAPELTSPPDPVSEETPAPVIEAHSPEASESKGSGGGLVVVLLLLALGGVGAYLYSQGQLPFLNNAAGPTTNGPMVTKRGPPAKTPIPADAKTPVAATNVSSALPGESGEADAAGETLDPDPDPVAELLAQAQAKETAGELEDALALYLDVLTRDADNATASARAEAIKASLAAAAAAADSSATPEETGDTVADSGDEVDPTGDPTGDTPPEPALVAYKIESNPDGAEVSVDDDKRGKTPLTVELAPGEHTVVVKRSGYRTEKKTVKIAAGSKPKPLSFKLRKTTTKKSNHNSENVEIDPEEGVVTKFEVPRKK
ncbi:MAG: protein kinase [Myxococcales bacterium]|nr:protein kinase [Myxococcales bacterium]